MFTQRRPIATARGRARARLALCLCGSLLYTSTGAAQSLGQLAQAEAARRAASNAKVPKYTTENIERLLAAGAAVPSAPAAPAAPKTALTSPAAEIEPEAAPRNASRTHASAAAAPAAAAPAVPPSAPRLVNASDTTVSAPARTAKPSPGALRGAPASRADAAAIEVELDGQDPPGDDAIVGVVLNAVEKGDVAIRVAGSKVYITLATLRDLGLRLPERPGEAAWIELDSIRTLIRSTLDLERLVLHLDANADLFPSTRLGARSARPEGLAVTSTPSAFVNYGVNWQAGGRATLATDLGVSIGTGRVRSELSTRADGGWLRGLTHLQFDDTRRLVRWTVGDTLASSGPLGGDGLVSGVRVTRSYSIDPYYIHAPALDIHGMASTPSTVEVYVNGFLVERRPIAPGQYDLSGVTLPDGRGVVQTVVRDAFGRTQTFETPYYQASGLLADGLQEFDYAFGWQRNSFDREFWSYGHPALYAQHRLGITSRFTAGARLEARNDMYNAGLSAAFGLPVGELQTSFAVSDDGTDRGWSALGSYLFRLHPFSAGTSWRLASDGYGTVQARPFSRQQAVTGSSFVGFPLWRLGSLTFRHNYNESFDGVGRHGGGASGSIRLGRLGQLFLTADRSRDIAGVLQNTLYAGLSVATGGGSSVALTAEHGSRAAGSTRYGIDAQRSLPVGPGFGYHVRLAADDSVGGSGMLQYQNSFGRYELRQEITETGRRTSGQIAGGLVAIDGSVFATRPVSGSFVAVRTGVPGVRGFLGNREVGRTDSRGRLFVPNALPYYGNQVSVASEDFPLDYEIDKTRFLVAPPDGGGSLVVFEARRFTSVGGRITLGSADQPARFGRMTLNVGGDATREIDLGSDGEFAFEHLTGGVYAASVEMEGYTCTASITVPAQQSVFTDIGTFACAVR